VPSNNKFFNFLYKNGPTIGTYAGVGLMAGSSVAACIATKKVVEKKYEAPKEEPKTEEKAEEKKDISKVKKIWNEVKPYVPAAVMMAGGAACIVTSHMTMQQRNAALTAQIGTMTAAVAAYRKRVADKVGEDEEKKLFFDKVIEETVLTEDGKEVKKKTTVTEIPEDITNSFYFDRYCSWRADPDGDIEFDMQLLKSIQAIMNQIGWASSNHMVTVNQVYEECQLYREVSGRKIQLMTIKGQVGGWIFDKANPNGDNMILFDCTPTTRQLDDGRIVNTVLVELNVDGNIMLPAKERGLIE